MSSNTSRRNALKNILVGGTAMAAMPALSHATSDADDKKKPLKNNINHSVCRWTYNFLSLEELCKTVKQLGFAAIDLIGPKDWDLLKQHGVYSSMCNGAEINLVNGFNNTQYHPALIKNYTDHIGLVAKAGYKNLICFSGNRNGMDDETGLKNCVTGLKQVLGEAEKQGVQQQGRP
jgi:hydroxypyruvate isomerase